MFTYSKLLALLFLSFIMGNTNAQNISISPIQGNAQLETIITNIFGVQCQGVSNVVYSGHPQQMGRFDYGQSLGLNSGLVLSTGLIDNALLSSPSYVQGSLNMGQAGDVDIYNYGVANNQNSFSLDAASVTFNFSPSITDTIHFNYIMASEEYPEYSNSQYTDRFLYLVSENGGPYENIAFLPGTTTAVEINSVNQIVNSQYYVDNSSGPNSTFFVFDGYTVPFEAKFYAQIGSTYQIKIVIADIADGLYDSAILLNEQESYNDIAGTLTVNGSPAEGEIEVFHFTGDTIFATPIKTISVTSGNYLADSLPTGLYHVRFTPDPNLFPGVAPLYYTDGDTWSTATAIGLPCFINAASISNGSLPVLSGNGSISGTIVIDTSYLKSMTEPLANAIVKLYDGQNDVVAFTYSDAQGSYTFNSVPFGSYYIKLDVPYIPQVNNHLINISGDEVISGADFEVLTDGINAVDNLVAGLNQLEYSYVSTYPNPASEKLMIRNTENEDITYELVSLTGLVMNNGVVSFGLNEINTSDLSEGVYLLRLNNKETRKIMIKK